jgi:hypothetical protein
LAQRRFQACDGILFGFDSDDPHGVSVIVFRLPDLLIRIVDAHEIRPVVKKGWRREEDEREDHQTDHIVLDGTSLKRPE